jgi:hypothetical protein
MLERVYSCARALLCLALLVSASGASAEPWRLERETLQAGPIEGLSYSKRVLVRPSDGMRVQAHLAFFTSPAFRLEVVDLGAESAPSYPGMADAFRAAGCAAGVNGGFFHPDWRSLGLVIAQGRREGRFESAKLLSGVVYSDARGTHLVRRRAFRDHPGISALLQTGPYLVEGGRAVRGLSDRNQRRRTFLATDWRGHWVLGATSSLLTLAELGQCLASPQALTPWGVDRAINLDGGSSTGFFFEGGADGGDGRGAVVLEPRKRVRNLLGIRPR